MRIPKARKVSVIHSSAHIHYGVLAVSGAGQNQHGLIFTPGIRLLKIPRLSVDKQRLCSGSDLCHHMVASVLLVQTARVKES